MKNDKLNNVIDSYNQRIRSTIKVFFKGSVCDDEIDDIQQAVNIKTWKNIDKVNDSLNLSGWIKTITINSCKDYTKSKKKIVYLEEEKINEIRDTKLEPQYKAEITERHTQILNAISSLPPKFKEVIILHEIEEMTHEEIAEKINCPVGTVKSRLFKAKQLLRISLKNLL